MNVYAKLPASVGTTILEPILANQHIVYTYEENEDEIAIYHKLNQQLLTIERIETSESTLLETFKKDMQKLRMYLEGKKELQMRVNWLNRLYQAEEQLKTIQTKEDAKKLLRYISSCQTSPLKRNLSQKLDELIQSLPPVQVNKAPLTDAEALMSFTIEEVGNDFINLGKAGRKYIIQEVLERLGKDAPVEGIQEAVDSLNKRLNDLMGVSDLNVFQDELEALPLTFYKTLSSERKHQVAEQLMRSNEWKGLMSLSRSLRLVDKKLDEDEEHEMIRSLENNLKTTLTVDQLEKYPFQFIKKGE